MTEVQGRSILSSEYSRNGSPLVKCIAHMGNTVEENNTIVIDGVKM